MKIIRLSAVLALALAAAGIAGAAEVRGTYLEARNAEIYASHCFANSETGIRGDLATMAWKIESGSLGGVSLDGLSVAAVVKASATLGDPFGSPLPTKTVLIFDERADAEQRAALESLAKRAAGELISDIVAREAAPVTLEAHGDLHAKRVSFRAGELARIETRAIENSDSLCHLDNIYYQPLVELDHAMAAFSVVNSYHGPALDTSYDDFNRSSAYLGTFVLSSDGLSD